MQRSAILEVYYNQTACSIEVHIWPISFSLTRLNFYCTIYTHKFSVVSTDESWVAPLESRCAICPRQHQSL